MNVKIPILAQDRKNKQEIDFYIEGHKQLNITDPQNELEVIRYNTGSKSIINTFFLTAANAVAKFMVVVVLPTPPF